MAKTWKKVGTIRKSKTGGLYIKIDTDLNLKAGQSLNLQDPRKSLDSAVGAGRMSAEKAEGIKAKIPDYIRQELFLVEGE